MGRPGRVPRTKFGVKRTELDTLSFWLPLPPTANNLFPTGRSGKRFRSPEYEAWKREAGLVCTARGFAVPGQISVLYEYSFGDRRRRDIFNYEKAVSDFLVLHQIIDDDCLIEEGTVRRVKAERTGVCVTIRRFRP